MSDIFQCIGQKYTQEHADAQRKLTRCMNTSPTPTRADKPEWGYICPECANAPANRSNGQAREEVNVGALQVDPDEYRDQAESSFAAGVRRSAVMDTDYYEED